MALAAGLRQIGGIDARLGSDEARILWTPWQLEQLADRFRARLCGESVEGGVEAHNAVPGQTEPPGMKRTRYDISAGITHVVRVHRGSRFVGDKSSARRDNPCRPAPGSPPGFTACPVHAVLIFPENIEWQDPHKSGTPARNWRSWPLPVHGPCHGRWHSPAP